ncbi:MAG TPA: ABC transporter substrate-binding protein [Marmoricola sp.]|jgi:peptide/nickel transport system substrate-binding protein|nr:ABC transporter substrate-binding protein [Marmoricola sp.]
MRLRKPLAVAAAGALALSLAACGSNGGSGDGNGDDGAKYQEGLSGADKDPTAKGPAQPIPNAVKGGTVTVLLPSPDTGPATLDPTAGWSVTGNSIQQDLVNRSLTTFKQDPETGNMILVPDLATDLGTPNKDFTEWKFTLKDGIKYDNGKPVTAEDIKFGIMRSFDGNNGTEGGGVAGAGTEYSAKYFLDGDKYNGPYDKSTKGQDYEGVTVEGNDITIKMSQPFPDMDYWGSFMAMGPIPQGNVSNPPGYGNKPWATGPYKVESFQPEKELTLVRNDQWDPATDPARHNYPDKWVFKFDQDAQTTDALMLSNNEASKTTLTTSVLAENYSDAKSKVGDRLVQGSTMCTAFTTFDMDKITDLKVRQAIAYAYPYEDAWAAAGEVVGVTRTMGDAILPPGTAGRESYGPINGEKPSHDPEKAKELLKEAGIEPGTYKLTWVYTANDPQAAAGKNQVARAYKEAGFVPNPLPYDGSLYDVWTAPKDGKDTAARLNRATNLDGVAWCSDWPSALTFIPALLRSGATYNTSGFSEKSIDDKMSEITTMPLEEQPKAWAELDKEIETKYYPMMNTGYINNLMIYGEKIGGFMNDPAMGAPNYRDIYVMK